jgi:hypothetical protein
MEEDRVNRAPRRRDPDSLVHSDLGAHGGAWHTVGTQNSKEDVECAWHSAWHRRILNPALKACWDADREAISSPQTEGGEAGSRSAIS